MTEITLFFLDPKSNEIYELTDRETGEVLATGYSHFEEVAFTLEGTITDLREEQGYKYVCTYHGELKPDRHSEHIIERDGGEKDFADQARDLSDDNIAPDKHPGSEPS
jgi:hypothetical protein